MKKITIGIPAFHAEQHICDLISSIYIQTVRDEIKVIIAPDDPKDNYEFVKKRFPELEIEILKCEKNTGPGLARQRALDACDTDWITFADADDVFMGPFAIEQLYVKCEMNSVEVMGGFLQEVKDNPNVRAIPRNDIPHPWVFGRLYNTKFLKGNGIAFSSLRAMEDGEFNLKIRLLIEGTKFFIKNIESPVYLWRTGSEHSITRIGVKDGIPQYNFDLCQVGAVISTINAVNFVREKNPFNGNINRFITDFMVGSYFTYIECLAKRPEFAEQNFFNAKRFYNECYKMIDQQIGKNVLADMYTKHFAAKANDLIGIIPEITFFEFMDKVRTEEYNGEEEFKAIREKLPEDIIENDVKSGVLESLGIK